MENEKAPARSMTASDLEGMFDSAVAAQLEGRIDDAARIYRKLLVLAPDVPEAVCNLGVCLRKQEDLVGAEALFRRAVSLRPTYVDAWHNLGVVSEKRGNQTQAIEAFSHALASQPDHPEALASRGQLYAETGRLEQAVADWRRAAELLPDNVGLKVVLAIALQRLDRDQEAAAFYREALKLAPDAAVPLTNLASIQRGRGEFAEALELYERAIAADPELIDARIGRSGALYGLKRYEDTARACIEMIASGKVPDTTQNLLGMAIYNCFAFGDPETGRALARQWLEVSPDHPVAQHQGRALAGMEVPDRASDSYVRHVFDSFSSTFDETLKRLEYRAPQAIAEAVTPLLGSRDDLVILDAGCGTGLSAPLLRSYADTLLGVDLSNLMLDKARERGLYDRLEQVELTEWLEGHPAAYDVIVAADVLCYFGTLDRVMKAAAAALKPGGLLSYTVEKLAPGVEEIAVGAHGRYAHTESHVRRALAGAGLEIVKLTTEPLRRESMVMVLGLLVVARRPGGEAVAGSAAAG